MNLTALWDVSNQFNHKNGSILAGGKIYVFYESRSQLATTYVDGSGQVVNPNPILLDNNGRATCFADDAYSYTCVVCDFYGKEQFSFNPVGLGGQSSTAITKYNITSDSLNVTSAYDPSTNTKTFDIEIRNTNPQHWYGMYGATIQHDGSTTGITLPVPTNISYEGDFIDRIEDGKYIYLKEGIYLVDCVIRFEQDPEHLENRIEEVLVYTGNGNANEDQNFILDETGKYSYSANYRKCIKQSFVRIVKEGDRYSSNLLYFAPGFPVPCREMYIQSLSIVKLENYVGSGESTSGEVYKAGEHIVIDPYNVISTSGLVDVNEMSGYMRKDEYPTMDLVAGQGINIDVQNNSAFISASGFVTPTQLETALNSYVTEQTFNTNIQNINSGLSGKLDSSAYVAPVQSDWNQNDDSALDYIKNKPTIPSLEGYATEEYVLSQTSGKQDTLSFMYNNSGDIIGINNSAIAGGSGGGAVYQAGEGIGIQGNIISVSGSYLQTSAYTAPVNADWNSSSGLSEILNKPNTEEVQFEELDLSRYVQQDSLSAYAQKTDLSAYVQQSDLSDYATKNYVDTGLGNKLDTSAYVAPHEYTAGQNIAIQNDEISVSGTSTLVAGQNISITESGSSYVISSTGGSGGATYSAGTGIAIDENDVISVNSAVAMKSDLPDMSTYAQKSQLPTTETGKFTIPSNVSGGPIQMIVPTDDAPEGLLLTSNSDNIQGYSDSISSSYKYLYIGLKSPGYDQDFWSLAPTGRIVIEFDQNVPGVSINGYYGYNSQTTPGAGPSLTSSVTAGNVNRVEISGQNNIYQNTYTVYGKYINFSMYVPSGSMSNIPDDIWERATIKIYGPDASLGAIVNLNRYKLLNQVASSAPNSSLECQVTENSDHQQKVYLPSSFPTAAWGIRGAKFVQYGATSLPTELNSGTGALVVAYKSLGSSAYQFARLIRSYGTNSTAGYIDKHVFEYVDPDDNHIEYWIATTPYSSYTWTTETISYATSAQLATKQDALTFTYDSNDKIIGINNSGIGGTGGGSSYTAGTGIDITNDVISVDQSVIPSKTDLQNKLDTSAYVAPVNADWNATSGLAEILNRPNTEEVAFEELDLSDYVQQSDLSSYAQKTDLGNYQPTSGMSAYQTVAGMSSYAQKTDLNGYQPTSGMSAYQTVAGMSSYQTVAGMSDYAQKTDLSGKLDTSAYVAPVNADWDSSSGLSEILNKPSTEDVSFEELDLSNYASTSDLASYQPTSGMSSYATDQELASAVSGKQNKITAFNDSVLVNSLPASPVATTLYLIPEA